MVARRKKKRTHVNPEGDPKAAKVPKSFIIKAGALSKVATQLVADLRRVMEPNTAARLHERKRNKLKDYVSVAGPMGVSHILLLSQTESNTNLRIGKFPQGPTLFFRILSFSLTKEVMALQKKPKSPGNEYHNSPLLVLNNMPVESSHGKLFCSMFQNMFPTINTSKVKLADIRRVVLFHYDSEEDVIEFRHYLVTIKHVGMSKSVKRIIRSEIQDLSKFADAAEFVLKAEANLSDSEVEPDSIITLGPSRPTKAEGKKPSAPAPASASAPTAPKNEQRSVNLVEIGPRLKLSLIKVTDGLNAGKVLYHFPSEPMQQDQESDKELEDE